MKNGIFIIIVCQLMSFINAYSQYYPRMENPNYMQTKLLANFDDSLLNRGMWNVSAHQIKEGSGDKKLYIWVDSLATVSQSHGNLKLSMLYYPNYSTTD